MHRPRFLPIGIVARAIVAAAGAPAGGPAAGAPVPNPGARPKKGTRRYYDPGSQPQPCGTSRRLPHYTRKAPQGEADREAIARAEEKRERRRQRRRGDAP